jgi:dihydroflavonol-4-reductase
MQTFVTGGTGFVGGALVRKLIKTGHSVRALVRTGANTRQLDGLPVEKIPGNLSDLESLHKGTAGCDWVFHVAALYSYWGYPWEDFNNSNVEGTRHVLQAAQEAGVKRIVYTSSIAVLGITDDGSPGTEETPVTLSDMVGYYKRSKFLAEKVADEFAQDGAPVIIVNPAAPVGIGDHKPTATGKMVLDYLKGKMPAYVDTKLTIVDVDDVAEGHLLAATKGQIGERYILGGEILNLKEILDIMAEISGRPKVRYRIPVWLAYLWAYLDITLAHIIPRYVPMATPEKVRISRRGEAFDSSKAVRELGFPQNPARDALQKAIEWYQENGYVTI